MEKAFDNHEIIMIISFLKPFFLERVLPNPRLPVDDGVRAGDPLQPAQHPRAHPQGHAQ